MSPEWDIDKERLLIYMRMPAKKKLEWLGQMHDFMRRCYSSETKKIFWKLRGIK